jgi:Glycosyl-transferase for dystroglycan
MFSPQRRHAKSKRPDLSPMDASSHDLHEEIKEHGDRGLFAYFDRARRRLAKREPDTLLPTSYASSSNATHKIRPLTCNSFLMGGHYYPGKDKKRRHMRRKTLWYRLFCSTPGRQAASFLLLTYVILWHVLVPAKDWFGQLASQLSSSHRSRSPSWLQYDSSLKIPELAKEKLLSIELLAAKARLQLQPSVRDNRLGLLENIVPAWYHRNDPPAVKEPTKTQENTENTRNKEAAKDAPKKVVTVPPVEKAETPPTKVDNDGVKPPEKEVKDAPKNEDHVLPVEKTDKPPKKTEDDGAKPPEKELKVAPKQEDHVPPEKTNVKKEPVAQTEREGASIVESRMLQISSDKLVERTIHTPIEVAGSTSSCHTVDAEAYTTTLVVQTSLSRSWILNETCARWKDPIVAVVFVPHTQEVHIDLDVPSCPNLRVLHYLANEQESKTENYPVNRLRNVGLDAVTSSHVVVMDVDFVPAEGLADTVREAVKVLNKRHPDGADQHALVIPAFERLPPNPCDSDTDCARYLRSNSSFVPKTFDDLRTCVGEKECIVFQSNNNWEGHSTTNSSRWLQRVWYDDPDDKTIFKAISCFHTARYEPYVVLRWCPTTNTDDSKLPVAPYYDERFHGYGKNKIELISHLRKKGYRFSILPEGFIVHYPHAESIIKENWNDRKGSDLHVSMDQLYIQFLNELESMYQDAHEKSVKLCKREPQL